VASVTVDLVPGELPLEIFSQRLRLGAVPVVGIITKKHFRIDLRTVFPRQDEALVQSIVAALTVAPGRE
jgi:hypothetical protein